MPPPCRKLMFAGVRVEALPRIARPARRDANFDPLVELGALRAILRRNWIKPLRQSKVQRYAGRVIFGRAVIGDPLLEVDPDRLEGHI